MPPARNRASAHEEQRARLEIHGEALASRLIPQLEAPHGAEAHRGDVRLAAVRIVAVAVPAHGVVSVAVEVRENGVEADPGRGLCRLYRGADHIQPRRQPARRMHDAGVAIADRPVHRDQPRHRYLAAVDREALLLPVELAHETHQMSGARLRIEDGRNVGDAGWQIHPTTAARPGAASPCARAAARARSTRGRAVRPRTGMSASARIASSAAAPAVERPTACPRRASPIATPSSMRIRTRGMSRLIHSPTVSAAATPSAFTATMNPYFA